MNYFIIIDAVTLILGIYIIFVSLRMKKSSKIESTFVAEDEMKKIKDTAGYIAYIYPKSLVDRKSTRLNSSHANESRMPSSA